MNCSVNGNPQICKMYNLYKHVLSLRGSFLLYRLQSRLWFRFTLLVIYLLCGVYTEGKFKKLLFVSYLKVIYSH